MSSSHFAFTSFLLLLSLSCHTAAELQTPRLTPDARQSFLVSKPQGGILDSRIHDGRTITALLLAQKTALALSKVNLVQGRFAERTLQEDPVPGETSHPMHTMTVQEYDVSTDPQQQQDQQPARVSAAKPDDFNPASTNTNVWSQFQAQLPDAEAEGSQLAGPGAAAAESTPTEPAGLHNNADTQNSASSEPSDLSQEQGGWGEYPFSREAEAEAQAADAALAKALGRDWKNPYQQSEIPEELQKSLTAPVEQQKPADNEATADAAAAAASGEPSKFSISRASAVISGAYLNFTHNLNLTGPLNITEGLTKIQSGNVGPEAFLTAVLGTLVGILVCLCCCCLCGACHRRTAQAQYKPVSTKGDIEM